jgi:PAS domain S-box-containing protein
MSSAASTTDQSDQQEQIARLERQAERERKARLEAEGIAEKSLRHLYVQKERVGLLQAISAAANATGSVEEAMREALALVCAHTGWPVGHVYRRRGERLVPTGLWCGGEADDERFAGWRAVTEAIEFEAGEGLPGRVLATGHPAWIRDVTKDPNFPRAAAAAAHGLHGGMAFPVLIGSEVAAVLEFFSERAEEPDEVLLELMAYAGIQLGYVVERQRLERRYELILGAAGEGIYGLGDDGRTTFVNPTAAALLGWDVGDLLGQDQHALLHHHRADGTPYPAEACPIHAVLRDGRERRVAGEVFWRRDGTPLPVEYVATPLREGDAIVGVVVVFHDASEREELKMLQEAQRELAEANRRLEDRVFERTSELSAALDALRESEALLHSVTANALDGIVALEAVRDTEGQIVDFRWLLVNPTAEAIYGRSREALVGALQSKVLPAVKAAGLHEALARVVETGAPFRQEAPAPEEPGRWFSLSVSKLGDGVVALFRDISEAKGAEAALREREAQLQEAQRIAHVGSWRWDVGADVVTWSDELYRIFGMTPDGGQVTYERYVARLHPEDRERVQQAVADALEKKAGYEFEHRIVRPGGAVRWVYSVGRPVLGAGGAVVALQGTAQDVTDHVEAERALQRYAHELEESNDELAKFAYVASHDLQEPLRMVTSFLQLLERRYEEQLDESARQYIAYAVDGARRMQRLIQDLLAYSRVGTRGRDFEPVDSGEVVLDVLHDLGPSIEEAGAAVEAGSLPVVFADPTQLHQLFLNLVGNALKFHRPDVPGRIRISAERASLQDGRAGWRFAVADNGIGLDAQYAERIFQVFQRLHTREEYEGTGIGLAICKKIVERHGGTIRVESAPGEGATFTFTFPAPDAPGPAARPLAATS